MRLAVFIQKMEVFIQSIEDGHYLYNGLKVKATVKLTGVSLSTYTLRWNKPLFVKFGREVEDFF
jgi:hypothetical protein